MAESESTMLGANVFVVDAWLFDLFDSECANQRPFSLLQNPHPRKLSRVIELKLGPRPIFITGKSSRNSLDDGPATFIHGPEPLGLDL